VATFRSKNKPLRTFKAAKRVVPAGVHTVKVDRLATDGRGVARSAGKTIFVGGALAEELVDVRYTATHKNYDEAICVVVKEPSINRVEALCAHYQDCGGCNLQHLAYDEQLQLKQTSLQQQLNYLLVASEHDAINLSEAIVGQAYQYRHRARLAVDNNKKALSSGSNKTLVIKS
jgi:23S rRNA (uracil1939-C5)-methyltransferase